MIALECVARRIAFGSYLKRNPEVPEGTRFDELVCELFLKDDARHDPYMQWVDGRGYELHDPKQPTGDRSFLGCWPLEEAQRNNWYAQIMQPAELQTLLFGKLREVFLVLEKALADLNVTLVDIKIEFGWTHHGILMVGDMIDADAWRAWVDGDPAQSIDKQPFRDLEEVTPEALESVGLKYAQAAALTRRFLAAA